VDTADLLQRGARSLVVDLCKQLEDVVTAVPGLKRFAYSLARESVGMKPAGRTRNGAAAKGRLLAKLERARKLRNPTGRPKMTPAQKATMRRLTAERWATAKRLGYTGAKAPTNAVIETLKAAKAKKPQPKAAAPKANGGGSPE